MYHISDIKKYLRCERLYLYGKEVSSIYKPYLRSDENISEILKKYFKIDNCFMGVRNDSGEKFFEHESEYEWFLYPRFTDGEMRINVPVMHKTENGYDLYYLYYNTQIRDIDLITYRITLNLLHKKGIRTNDIFLLYLNEDYVSDGTLDVERLLKCTDRFREQRIRDLAEENGFDYLRFIRSMESFDTEQKKPKKGRFCKTNGLCEYYDRCFPDEQTEADDSILTLVSSSSKNKMYEKGIRLLKDADPDQLEGNKIQYAQIMASRNGGLFLDEYALKNWLNKLSDRPISFVDFEWDRYLIPAYEKMRPMDVVCFEFALYYIDENGQMEHRTFVGTGDCRREFVEALLKYMPKKGPILAYNAAGAECLRLKELADNFPEYRKELNRLNGRFVDLAVPFTEGLVYDIRMQGNFTLKRLVDICSDYSYADLEIYDGMEAVYNWRDVDKKIGTDKDKIVNSLIEYCSLDAYGLFLVYRWLVELVVSCPNKKTNRKGGT